MIRFCSLNITPSYPPSRTFFTLSEQSIAGILYSTIPAFAEEPPGKTSNLFVGTFQDFILPLFRHQPFGKHPVDILLGYLAIFLAALENQLADVSNLDDVHFSLPG